MASDRRRSITFIKFLGTHAEYDRIDAVTLILGRKPTLRLPMIRKIARAWHVPERVLVQDYALDA